jgi:hypothetical protein
MQCDGTGGLSISHKEKEHRTNRIARAIRVDCQRMKIIFIKLLEELPFINEVKFF